MSKSNLAVFAKDPQTASAVAVQSYALTGAQSLADSEPTNTVLLMKAGVEGALVTALSVITRGTNTATQAALFIRKESEADQRRNLLETLAISAQTVNTTARINRYLFELATDAAPLRLGPGDELYFGVAVSQSSGIVAHATYTNF